MGAGCCGSDPCCPEWSNVEHEEGRSSTTGGVWSPVESTWEYPAGGCYWQKNSKLVRKNRPSLFLYPTQINGFEHSTLSAQSLSDQHSRRSAKELQGPRVLVVSCVGKEKHTRRKQHLLYIGGFG